MALRARNTVLLFKQETTEGVDSAPTAGANAFAALNIDISPNPNILEDAEFRGGLGAGSIVVGATPMAAQISLNARGSGAAATPPEFGDLLEACGWVETINSAQVPAAGTTTAASGTATSVTFDRSIATDWSATNGAYVGHPIELTGNPATATISMCIGYTVSGNNATITFADTFSPVLSNATKVRRPISVLYATGSPSPFPSGSLYAYRDGVLWKLLGMRGDCQINLGAGGRGQFQFNLNGVFGSKTDVAVPTPTLQATASPPWLNSSCSINSVAAPVSQLSLALNNQGTFPEDPNQVEGLQAYVVTGRSVQGQVDPLLTLVATQNLFADLRANTTRPIAAMLGGKTGGTVGNRIGLVVPSAKFRNENLTDANGLLRIGVPFQAEGSNSEAYLSFF